MSSHSARCVERRIALSRACNMCLQLVSLSGPEAPCHRPDGDVRVASRGLTSDDRATAHSVPFPPLAVHLSFQHLRGHMQNPDAESAPGTPPPHDSRVRSSPPSRRVPSAAAFAPPPACRCVQIQPHSSRGCPDLSQADDVYYAVQSGSVQRLRGLLNPEDGSPPAPTTHADAVRSPSSRANTHAHGCIVARLLLLCSCARALRAAAQAGDCVLG